MRESQNRKAGTADSVVFQEQQLHRSFRISTRVSKNQNSTKTPPLLVPGNHARRPSTQ